MAKINGTDLTLYIPDQTASPSAWVAVACSKSASLSLSIDTPDASNKDSSGWAEVIGGQKSWSIDFEGLTDLDLDADAQNVKQLWTHFAARTKIKVAFGIAGYWWGGSGFISSLEQSAEMEQTVSFSGNITGTGTLENNTGVITNATSYDAAP